LGRSGSRRKRFNKQQTACRPWSLQAYAPEHLHDRSGKEPRYYQRNAINAAVEAIAKGQNRILLVMATHTSKTCPAFQII
jgi:type I site-specific restriction endonuclease